jgi:dienelactone hydrolase
MTRGRKALAIGLVLATVATMGYVAAHDYVESAAFVVRAANMQGIVRRAAGFEADAVSATPATIPWRGGQLRGRTYLPSKMRRRAILLVPGVHAGGIDEPRLINFAREIAATGHPVVTAELPDLARYEITPRSTDMIEDAGDWIGKTWGSRLPPSERVPGLMGISFGGGLAVVAASRMPGRAAWVVSFGGHGDLPRTLKFLCSGQQPDGSYRAPHDYGVVIILLGVADRLVPADQVVPLRAAIRIFLNASHLDMIDKKKAALEFARARESAGRLPEPAQTYMTWVNDRRVEKLGPVLLPHAATMGADAALSPERNPAPAMPVYLLHGADDDVIPAAESERLSDYLRGQHAEVMQLATPLITHAEVDHPPAVAEIWRLVRFWAAPL